MNQLNNQNYAKDPTSAYIETVNGAVTIHLRKMLFTRNMSIREFARRVGGRFDTVRKLHNGTIARVPLDLLVDCCRELDCQIDDLIEVTYKKKAD